MYLVCRRWSRLIIEDNILRDIIPHVTIVSVLPSCLFKKLSLEQKIALPNQIVSRTLTCPLRREFYIIWDQIYVQTVAIGKGPWLYFGRPWVCDDEHFFREFFVKSEQFRRKMLPYFSPKMLKCVPYVNKLYNTRRLEVAARLLYIQIRGSLIMDVVAAEHKKYSTGYSVK